jgi:hypothetical protein
LHLAETLAGNGLEHSGDWVASIREGLSINVTGELVKIEGVEAGLAAIR